MTLVPDRGQTPPWGIAATLGWLALAFVISTVVAMGAFSAFQVDSPRPKSGSYDGVVIAIGALVSIPVQVAVLAVAAQMRHWQPASYFGLNIPRRGELTFALISVVALIVVFNALLYFTGRDIVAPFQIEAYKSAQDAAWLLPLLFAIVIVAPAGEEIVFRGFLYRGLALPGREVHAIVIIALAWAMLHIQYDWLGMLQIFAIGLLLGWFRWASGSTSLAILMHVVVNLESMLETAIKVEYLS